MGRGPVVWDPDNLHWHAALRKPLVAKRLLACHGHCRPLLCEL